MPTILFTSETAKIASAKSAESRRQNPLKAVPPGWKLVPADYPEFVPTDNSFQQARLARIRTQLELVDRRIEEEAAKEKCDGQLLNWFCAAQERLSEQERITDGRPLPGSRRPKEDPTGRRTIDLHPEPTPRPIVSPETPQLADSEPMKTGQDVSGCGEGI